MARPRSAAFTTNTQGSAVFKLPDVKVNDLLGLPLFPDPAYFERPDDMVPGRKVIIRLNPDDPLFGQSYGYVAPKGQCILDNDPNECWTVPPSATDYEYAHQGLTTLSDGTMLATANIGGAGGHAPHEMGWAKVASFYEDVSTQRARVRYGEDDFGVYAVGIGVPTLTWGDAVSMVASATSGDWRWVDELGAWDFMGSCFVNLPAFPIHRKSGVRLVRAASATPIGDNCMIVTMTSPIEEEAEVSDHHECSCQTSVTAAATYTHWTGSTKAASVELPSVDMTPEEVQEIVDSALEARDAEWQTKLDSALAAAVEPIATRLSTVEEISLGVLDSAAV